jgi:hypothetical protein
LVREGELENSKQTEPETRRINKILRLYDAEVKMNMRLII